MDSKEKGKMIQATNFVALSSII